MKTSIFLTSALFIILSCFSSLTLIRQKKKVKKAIELLSKKMHLDKQIKTLNSLEDCVNQLKNKQKKEHLDRIAQQKVQTLGQILTTLYQSYKTLKIQSFSFKKEKEHQLVTIKIQDLDKSHKIYIDSLKKKHKKNLLTFQEYDDTIEYSLKY